VRARSLHHPRVNGLILTPNLNMQGVCARPLAPPPPPPIGSVPSVCVLMGSLYILTVYEHVHICVNPDIYIE